MKKALVSCVAILVLFLAGVAQAVTVEVNGQSQPWDPVANPGFSFGDWGPTATGGIAPAVVDSSLGLAMKAGDLLTITYLSGAVCAGAGGSVWGDQAKGVIGWYAVGSSTPAQYIPGVSPDNPVWLEELMGVFAKDGMIMGNPFGIANGPLSVVIPDGATQLLLGFNDGWYYDNFASLTVSVVETPRCDAVPEPASMLLLGLGLAGLAGVRRK